MSDQNTEAKRMAADVMYLKDIKDRLEVVRSGLSSDGEIWLDLKELEDEIQTAVDTRTKALIEHCLR